MEWWVKQLLLQLGEPRTRGKSCMCQCGPVVLVLRGRDGGSQGSVVSSVRPVVAQFVMSRADVTGKLFNLRLSGGKVRKTGHSKGHNIPFEVTSHTHNDLLTSHYAHPHLRFDHSSVVLWAED